MKFNVSSLIKYQHKATTSFILVFFAVLLIAGCNSNHYKDKKQLEADADSFATYYFNWQFQKAIPYCTPSSRKWLCYAASNVHSADINILRTKTDGASSHIHKIQFINDSTADVLCTVKDYVCMDTIGKAGRIIPQSLFRLSLVLHHNQWKIRMEDLPRSEKPDHGQNQGER